MIHQSGTFLRRSPDLILEELIAALQTGGAFEFKPLFEIIYAKLRTRNAISGGQEMLRLRAYERLQTLVRTGSVRKTGKIYREKRDSLRALSERIRQMQPKAASPG